MGQKKTFLRKMKITLVIYKKFATKNTKKIFFGEKNWKNDGMLKSQLLHFSAIVRNFNTRIYLNLYIRNWVLHQSKLITPVDIGNCVFKHMFRADAVRSQTTALCNIDNYQSRNGMIKNKVLFDSLENLTLDNMSFLKNTNLNS